MQHDEVSSLLRLTMKETMRSAESINFSHVFAKLVSFENGEHFIFENRPRTNGANAPLCRIARMGSAGHGERRVVRGVCEPLLARSFCVGMVLQSPPWPPIGQNVNHGKRKKGKMHFRTSTICELPRFRGVPRCLKIYTYMIKRRRENATNFRMG